MAGPIVVTSWLRSALPRRMVPPLPWWSDWWPNGSPMLRPEWLNHWNSEGPWSRPITSCVLSVPGRSTRRITPCGWALPEASMPTGTGGASRRATEPLGETIPAQHLAALPADRLADHVRTERAVAIARARLGWREPVTVDRGLGR